MPRNVEAYIRSRYKWPLQLLQPSVNDSTRPNVKARKPFEIRLQESIGWSEFMRVHAVSSKLKNQNVCRIHTATNIGMAKGGSVLELAHVASLLPQNIGFQEATTWLWLNNIWIYFEILISIMFIFHDVTIFGKSYIDMSLSPSATIKLSWPLAGPHPFRLKPLEGACPLLSTYLSCGVCWWHSALSWWDPLDP